MRAALALIATRFVIDERALLEFWATAPVQQLLQRGAAGEAETEDDADGVRALAWPAGFAPPRSPAKSAHRAASPQRALREWAWTDAAAGASGGDAQRSTDRVDRDRRAEEEEVRADEAWALMKSYSLLVVKDGESRASLHRLLQLLLRSHQSPRAASVAISSCVWAVLRLWRFEVNDSTTWGEAGALVDHIKALATHAAALGVCRLRVGALLTSAAHYLSVALSHFGEAQEALECALAMIRAELQERRAEGAAAGAEGAAEGAEAEAAATARFDHSASAAAMRRMGQVLRYRGDLDGAAQWLNRALSMERRMNSTSPGLAETLHELGVLRARQGAAESARDLLSEALRIKVGLQRRRDSAGGADGAEATAERDRARDCFGEAATLHQLAIVATLAKPPRFDEATRLLQRVLAKTRTSPAARASSMQQLARIATRRGAVEAAHAWLSEALALHETAYRSKYHVNIAAAHQKLGLAEMAMKPTPRLDSAEIHLNQCLAIRRRLYAADHVEVAAALHSLGRLERERGAEAAAAAHFAAQRAMLGRLFDAEEARLSAAEAARSAAAKSGGRRRGGAAAAAGDGGTRTLAILRKGLVMAIGWQQVLARGRGDRKALRALAKDMQNLERRTSAAESGAGASAARSALAPPPLSDVARAATACRTRVRTGLLDRAADAAALAAMLRHEAAALQRELDSTAQRGGGVCAGSEACALFCARIAQAAEARSKRAAFEACDDLRAELAAALGGRIEDESS